MGVDQNNWLVVGYIPGDINTPGGLTKSLSSVNLRRLLSGNISRLVTEERKKEIRRKISSQNTILLTLELFRGKKDPNADMRRKTRAGRRWQMVLDWRHSFNSFL